MSNTTCARCAQPVDLAEPHVSVIEQREVERDGVVTVLGSPAEPLYRHDVCGPARLPLDGPCDTCDPLADGPPCAGVDGWCPGRGRLPAPRSIPAPREATS